MVRRTEVKAPFLPFHRPTIYDHHVQAVVDAVRSGWLTSAGNVDRFEKAFARKVGAKYAVAVNSCTAALHLALIGLGVRPMDEVITSPITFVSAVNVIEHVGATPVFADVCREDLTLDPESVLKRASPKTVLIIATHFAGFPAHMDKLESVAGRLGVPIVTDAAHGIELVYHGRQSGQLGRVACYSFYATKNITTGEGGMLVTDDRALAGRARVLRLHGMTKDAWSRYGQDGYKHWDVTEPGWKYNMSDIQAALGLAQLDDMEAWLDKRILLERAYLDCLDRRKLDVFQWDDALLDRRARHLLVVRVPKRDQIMDEMQKRGVGVGVHFRAVHHLDYYRRKYKDWQDPLPVAEQASDEVLSLPLYPSMEIGDVHRVVDTLNQALRSVGV